jgi:hypothetical protein
MNSTLHSASTSSALAMRRDARPYRRRAVVDPFRLTTWSRAVSPRGETP